MNRISRWLLIIFIVVVLVCVLLEIFYKSFDHSSSKDLKKGETFYANEQIVKPVDEQLVQPQPSESRDDLIPSYLFDNINKFLELIISKDYKEAYNLLYPEYRTKYFPDLKKFTDYCNKILSGLNKDSLLLYEEHKIDENTFTCKVKLKLKSTPDAESVFDDYFTVYFMDQDKKFNLSMFGYIGSKKVNFGTKSGKIKFNITKTTDSFDNTELSLEVYNGETQPISVMDKNSFFLLGDSDLLSSEDIFIINEKGETGDCYADDILEPDYTVKPNSTAKFTLHFYNLCYEKIKKLSFNNIKIGQEVRKAEIELK